MKTTLIPLLAFFLITANGFSRDDFGSYTRIAQVAVEESSVTIKSYSQVPQQDHLYKVEIGFKIQARDACEANYAGLYEVDSDKNNYVVTYSKTLNSVCADVAIDKEVSHFIYLDFDSEFIPRFESIILNGINYTIVDEGGFLHLKKGRGSR
ncbi:MAG: hypothetical protein H6621_12485 [Halobacteriovoraceae bacterium]|nr:hypothetical protein [Halobacteriovoraceae bacterium]